MFTTPAVAAINNAIVRSVCQIKTSVCRLMLLEITSDLLDCEFFIFTTSKRCALHFHIHFLSRAEHHGYFAECTLVYKIRLQDSNHWVIVPLKYSNLRWQQKQSNKFVIMYVILRIRLWFWQFKVIALAVQGHCLLRRQLSHLNITEMSLLWSIVWQRQYW